MKQPKDKARHDKLAGLVDNMLVLMPKRQAAQTDKERANCMASPKKKSPSSKPSKVGTRRRLVRRVHRVTRTGSGRAGGSTLPVTAGKPRARAEFRAWRAALPTALERDTLLWPEAIAESVVQEASRYLGAELPADYPARLAAKAYHLYPRHRHFHKVLNRPGNRGRDNLYVYMRHWTCAWLKRDDYRLYKKLPWAYALGRALPLTRFSPSHKGG